MRRTVQSHTKRARVGWPPGSTDPLRLPSSDAHSCNTFIVHGSTLEMSYAKRYIPLLDWVGLRASTDDPRTGAAKTLINRFLFHL